MPTRKHYVTFLSPGTFVSEQTTQAVAEWDPRVAAHMATSIVERYDAKPYGFYFTTCLCADPVPDGEGGTLEVESKEVARSGFYHLTGKICSAKDFDPKEHDILLSNMRCNDLPLVVVTTNSYRHTFPFQEKDFVVDADGTIVERGDDPKHVAFRQDVIARHRAEIEAEFAKDRA